MLTLTPITWTVRTGLAHEQYGDPYEGVATVQRCGDVAHVSAACGRLPLGDQVELSRMLREMGFSAIVFERVVGGAAGLTPKRFQRVARLHHTMRHLLLARETDYLDAALERGYYDQSHFIHETGELTGCTPGELLTRESFMSHFYNPRLAR